MFFPPGYLNGEFHIDRPLWVLKVGDSFLVKDGNRRCAAAKALQVPGKFGLAQKKFPLKELPCLIYTSKLLLDKRIGEEHNQSLFRQWERIAKALEVLRLIETNASNEQLLTIDSKPGEFIKLATFYREAVKVGGNGLRELLRRGRSKNSGKTIIFERLFRDAKSCGYQFKPAPHYTIEILNREKFNSYVLALIKYIYSDPELKTETVDKNKNFIQLLVGHGFKVDLKNEDTGQKTDSQSEGENSKKPDNSQNSINDSDTSVKSTNSNSGPKIKTKPILKRKSLPRNLVKRIDEYFSLSVKDKPFTKVVMSRVIYECTLKYVLETTKYKNKTFLYRTTPFQKSYKDQKDGTKKYTKFSEVSTAFIELILQTSVKAIFDEFEMGHSHNIIHNFRAGTHVTKAEKFNEDILEIIEFLLQEEEEFLTNIDCSKL